MLFYFRKRRRVFERKAHEMVLIYFRDSLSAPKPYRGLQKTRFAGILFHGLGFYLPEHFLYFRFSLIESRNAIFQFDYVALEHLSAEKPRGEITFAPLIKSFLKESAVFTIRILGHPPKATLYFGVRCLPRRYCFSLPLPICTKHHRYGHRSMVPLGRNGLSNSLVDGKRRGARIGLWKSLN